MWGDFDSASRKDLATSAESGWEALLEARKLPRQGPAAGLWGEVDEPGPKRRRTEPVRCRGILFRLGVDAGGTRQQDLEVRNTQLITRLPALASLIAPVEGSELAGAVDFQALGASRIALLAAVEFALAGPGANERSEELWIPKQQRAISKASKASCEVVERALHALELLRCANHLAIPRLQEEAERRLLGSDDRQLQPLLCEASAIPLLATSFRREKIISQRCMQLLVNCGPEFLLGRERQLGVVYATQPLVGCVLSGIFKASKPSSSPSAIPAIPWIPWSPVLEDLLLGPKSVAPAPEPRGVTAPVEFALTHQCEQNLQQSPVQLRSCDSFNSSIT